MRKYTPLLLVALATTACDDPFALENLNSVSDTVTVYSLSRTELQGLPSAFDFLSRRTIVLEAGAAAWDIALVDDDGVLSLAPEPLITGSNSRAGIGVDSTRTFEEVRRAARDTAAYDRFETVPLDVDHVYIVRTRSAGGCVFYAKLQPLVVDPAAGRLEFRFLHNPNCNGRELLPPED